jgi:hypothetical protein
MSLQSANMGRTGYEHGLPGELDDVPKMNHGSRCASSQTACDGGGLASKKRHRQVSCIAGKVVVISDESSCTSCIRLPNPQYTW